MRHRSPARRHRASEPHRSARPASQRGFVLIGTLFVSALIVAWLSVSSNYLATESRLFRQQHELLQASLVAEAGIQQFIWNVDLPTNDVNTKLSTPITNQSWGGGRFTVTWTPIGNTNRFDVRSTGTTAQGTQRRARAIVTLPGIVSRQYAGFGEEGVSLDRAVTGSYNSSTHPWLSFGGLTGMNADLASNGVITATNNTLVRGDAFVQGDPMTDIQTVSSTITGSRAGLPYAYVPPAPNFDTYASLPVLPDCQPMPAGTYRDWSGGNGFELGGGVECYTDGTGPVTIYVRGPVTLTGGALSGYFKPGAQYYRSARNLTIIAEPRAGHEAGTPEEDKVTLTGGGFTYATIYAPQMNMEITGSNNFAIGSIVARQITVTSGGGNSGVYYDDYFQTNPLVLNRIPAVVEAFYFE